MDPTTACENAVARVAEYYSDFALGMVCLGKNGTYGGASHGWTFTYAVASPATGGKVVTVPVPPS